MQQLIIGGLLSPFGGPTPAGAVFHTKGVEYTMVMVTLGVLPIVLGIDAIFRGLHRKRDQQLQQEARQLPQA